MKNSLIAVVLLSCAVVSLVLVFFYNQAATKLWTPAMHFILGKNSNSSLMGEYLSLLGNKERQRQQRTREALVQTEKKTLNTSGKGQTLRSGIKTKERSSKNGERDETEERYQPKRALTTKKNLIILSPGRGGSSFLGSLFNNNLHVMYVFEPLYSIATKMFNLSLLHDVDKEPKHYKETCIKVIDSFFQCDFSSISNVTLSAFSNSHFHLRKSRALSKRNLPRVTNPALSKVFRTYNHTVIKILSGRVPNNTIQTLMEVFQQQNQYDVKLVHLVRDPRAVINSRVKLKWMKNHLDPSFRKNVHKICDPILENMRFGLQFRPPWLRNRFKVIRYEDLALNTWNVSKELYRFAGFDWSASVDKWISTLSKNTKQGRAYSLYRNASAAIDGWKSAPEPFIRDVENICGDLIDFLGYEKWRKQ